MNRFVEELQMNEVAQVMPDREENTKKGSYERPKVTTFGSVAELTLGSSGTTTDAGGTKPHRDARI